MVMPVYTSLVVLYIISAPASDSTASSNNNSIVFGPFIAAARSYTSPMYIILDF